MKKHGTDAEHRVWRKLNLAVDTDTYEIIADELTLSSGVTDAGVLLNLLKQTHRATKEISRNGSYETRECHKAIRAKKAIPLRSLLGKGTSTQSSGWLPETLWVEQKVETELWLPQTLTA